MFLELPVSSQALYFHLLVHCDDDGFCDSPKTIQRNVGASVDDLRVLCAKGFIIAFDTGVIVIRHWRVHNYIQSDRYKPTVHQTEKDQLLVDEGKVYRTEKDRLLVDEGKDYQTDKNALYTDCIQNVSQLNKLNKLNKLNNINNIGQQENADSLTEEANEVIRYLNFAAEKNYGFINSHQAFIKARLKEGHTVEDCKKVVDIKVAEWKGTDNDKFLRPKTLFNPSNFEGYLNQKTIRSKSKNNFNNFDQHGYDIKDLTKRAKE